MTVSPFITLPEAINLSLYAFALVAVFLFVWRMLSLAISIAHIRAVDQSRATANAAAIKLFNDTVADTKSSDSLRCTALACIAAGAFGYAPVIHCTTAVDRK